MPFIDPNKIVIENRLREDLGDIDELARSIEEIGQLQPIIVKKEQKKLKLIAGQRRLEACRKLGREVWYVDASDQGIIVDTPAKKRRIELQENIMRKQMNPLEKAIGISEIDRLQKNEYGQSVGSRYPQGGWSYEDTAKMLGFKSKASVGFAVKIALAADNNPELAQKLANAKTDQEALKIVKRFEKPEVSQSPIYGPPINFRDLRHEPTEELGVVYLFGMVGRELGFVVEAIGRGFPDCKAKYLQDPKKNRWSDARIEFEYKASNFKLHRHDSKQCDFIVCWENDWLDCPIKIIELKKEIMKLSPK